MQHTGSVARCGPTSLPVPMQPNATPWFVNLSFSEPEACILSIVHDSGVLDLSTQHPYFHSSQRQAVVLGIHIHDNVLL